MAALTPPDAARLRAEIEHEAEHLARTAAEIRARVDVEAQLRLTRT